MTCGIKARVSEKVSRNSAKTRKTFKSVRKLRLAGCSEAGAPVIPGNARRHTSPQSVSDPSRLQQDKTEAMLQTMTQAVARSMGSMLLRFEDRVEEKMRQEIRSSLRSGHEQCEVGVGGGRRGGRRGQVGGGGGLSPQGT
jgi:hypothetical protein